MAMLNYGEMQILENFKNTLPYRLYSTLINVNNLRDAIDLAKRVLNKEKLDRQLTGQSSTPFMKASSNDSHSPKNHHKKGVTFDAMEMLERNSDCIDRLTLLVSNMKMTMDRKQSPYKPKIYQGRSRNQNVNQQNFTPRNRSFSRGRNQGGNRGNYNNRNQIIEIDQEADGTIIGKVIGVIIIRITIDEVIRDQITDKMPNGLLGTEVKVGIEMKIITMTKLEEGVEIETIVDLSQGEEKSPGPNLTPGLVLIVIESGVTDVRNMIILHPNVLIPQLMRRLTMKM